jgi:tetratricopeptide (TPR) repeat protein
MLCICTQAEAQKKAKGKKVNVTAYVQQGDTALAHGDVGQACQLYEQAIYFDPDYVEAYLKYAKAYQTVSPTQAISKLDELKQRKPDCAEADKALADVYYSSNQFRKAVETYARFIDTPQADDTDRTRYAFALFFNHEFGKSLERATQGLAKDPRDAVYNRLAMYNYVDLKRYDEARQAADRFFHHSDSARYSRLDTLYYGQLWKGMADSYAANDDYTNAIPAYRTYYQTLAPGERTPDVLLQMGRLYYGQGTSADSASVTPTLREEALLKADTIFAQLATEAPQSYMGNFWRARVNSALDPETTAGKAKPYYEATVALLTAADSASHTRQLIECYSYLGYYHLLTGDLATSVDYWNKILALAPDNAVAKRALEGIDKMKSRGAAKKGEVKR